MITAADILDGDRPWLLAEVGDLITVATATIDKTAPGADERSKDLAVEMFATYSIGRLHVEGDPWADSGASAVLRRFTVRRAATL